MKLRKITSLTALLSFIILLLTSIILYIVPEGRVAYWSDWHLLGLSKTEWGNLHINFGILFVAFGLLHVYYNWSPLVSYLRNKRRKLSVFTRNFNIALLLAVACAVGTFLELPPFKWTLSIGESIKDAASNKYGEPPYGHAELSSLKLLSKRMGLDLEAGMAALEKAGIRFESETESILEIAQANGLTPKAVYEKMQPETKETETAAMPEFPQPGLGKRTIAEICSQYGIDPTVVVKGLNERGVHTTPEMTFREIADNNDTSPADIYALVFETAHQ
jgi:hypothetical protein